MAKNIDFTSKNNYTTTTKSNKKLNELKNKLKSFYESLDEKTKNIIDTLNSGTKVFLTGAAGTGKTYTTKLIQKYFKLKYEIEYFEELESGTEEDDIIKKGVAYTSSTGVSALINNGITIHKLLKSGISQDLIQLEAWDNSRTSYMAGLLARKNPNLSEKELFIKAKKILKNKLRNELKSVGLLIVDEVSMLDAYFLEIIKKRLNYYNPDIQVLFVGDFAQLPPVSKTSQKNFMFENPSFNEYQLALLTEVKRTTDPKLIKVLGELRLGQASQETINFLYSRNIPYDREQERISTHLFSLKKDVIDKNAEMLNQLDEKEITLCGKAVLGLPSSEKFKSFLKKSNIEEQIKIKNGARIIFTVNQIGGSDYINGEIGTVVRIERPNTKSPTIYIKRDRDGNVVGIDRHEFTEWKIVESIEYKRYKGKTHAVKSFTLEPELIYAQYPFALGYATTIHKSQGSSIDNLIVDCKGIFEYGQFYVAISRATSSKGLFLKNFNEGFIKAHPEVVDYYDNLEQTVAQKDDKISKEQLCKF